MNLELAIVLACNKAGCRVTLVKDNLPIEARYSSLVQDRIKIQPEQMVAIDMNANPPEIVWRWLRAAIVELTTDIVVMDELYGHPAKVSLPPDLPLELALDDEVWTCSTGRDIEIHDLILDGKPTDPNRLLKYITPIIEEVYQLKYSDDIGK